MFPICPSCGEAFVAGETVVPNSIIFENADGTVTVSAGNAPWIHRACPKPV
jgi:hypothetical protein